MTDRRERILAGLDRLAPSLGMKAVILTLAIGVMVPVLLSIAVGIVSLALGERSDISVVSVLVICCAAVAIGAAATATVMLGRRARRARLQSDLLATVSNELPELLNSPEGTPRDGRPDEAEEPPVAFGAVVLDRKRRQVFVDGREVEISSKEYGLLALLADIPGRPRTRSEILDHVWGWDFAGSPRTVDNFIRSLRQKLEVDPADPHHILTVRGVGYKLAIG